MRRAIISVACLSFVLAAPAAAQRPPPNIAQIEIETQKVAPGVAVLFNGGSNVGVSYGPDGVLLIDDKFAAMTDKIIAAVAGLSRQPIRYLANTHWHGDHTDGNASLAKAGVLIFAQDNVRARLAAGSTAERTGRAPASAAALPVITFAQGMSFQLNGDQIDAVYLGGHTDGDTVYFWRKANIIHVGDLMMSNEPFPLIDTASGGNAVHFISALDRVIAMTNDATRVIPGHGPIATRAELIVWRNRLADATDLLRKAKAAGETLDQVQARRPLAAFDKPGAKPGDFMSTDFVVKTIWDSL